MLERVDLGEVPYAEAIEAMRGWVEHGLIDALSTLGFDAIRRDTPQGAQSLVGVWTPGHQKLVSIGMRIRHGVTSRDRRT